ncbi:DUF397 domain-containing protein [Streptomyces sp. NPDC001933]
MPGESRRSWTCSGTGGDCVEVGGASGFVPVRDSEASRQPA